MEQLGIVFLSLEVTRVAPCSLPMQRLESKSVEEPRTRGSSGRKQSYFRYQSSSHVNDLTP